MSVKLEIRPPVNGSPVATVSIRDDHGVEIPNRRVSLDDADDIDQFVSEAESMFGADAAGELNKQLAEELKQYKARGDTTIPKRLIPINIFDLLDKNPNEREYLIVGIARRMEVGAIVSGSKAFKTWTALAMALCLAAGRCWLGIFATVKTKVLYIDNELSPNTLAHRIRSIMSALAISRDEIADTFKVLPLRGERQTIETIGHHLREYQHGELGAIFLDSLYKSLPPDVDENSNTQMGDVFNRIDAYANETGAAFIIIHHSPKGDTSGRDLIDLTSGAGAIGRSVDFMIGVRRHEQTMCGVFQFKTRTSADPEAVGARFIAPAWQVDYNLPVDKLHRPGKAAKASTPQPPPPDPIKEALEKRQRAEAELAAFIASYLSTEPRSKKAIIALAEGDGHKAAPARRLLDRAVVLNRVHKWPGRSTTPDRYATVPPTLMDSIDVADEGSKPRKTNGKRRQKTT